MDLSKFKNRKTNIEKLVEAAKASNSPKSSKEDARFWRPTVDAAGNGYAIIRFLPIAGDGLPWTKYWDHAFKGPTGQWFIEKSLTSLDQVCPVSEANSVLWNSKQEELARERKRRLHYVANIYVVADPSAPENVGKVFLFSFGKKIFDKLIEAMHPEFPDETPFSPFDLWEGADFQLKIRNLAGYRNYDKSEFKKPAPLLDGDEAKLTAVVESLYSLDEFTDPKNYKSYDELKKLLNKVLGESGNSPSMAAKVDAMEDDIPFDTADARHIPSQSPDESDSKDVEDAMSFFNKIAQES